jgi:hypothetical protein
MPFRITPFAVGRLRGSVAQNVLPLITKPNKSQTET